MNRLRFNPKPAFRGLMVAALLAAMSSSACKRNRLPWLNLEGTIEESAIAPVPDWPEERFIANQAPADLPTTPPDADEIVFNSTGEGTFPANSSGGVQRLAFARAEARRAALRRLARKILATSGYENSFPDLIAANPRARQDLLRAIETQTHVEYAESGEKVTATARITIGQLMLGTGKNRDQDRQTPEAGQAPLIPSTQRINESRVRAQELALEAARKLLHDDILNLSTNNGGTLRQLTFRNPELEDKIQSLLANVEPAEVNWSDGACEVKIVFEKIWLAGLLPQSTGDGNINAFQSGRMDRQN